MAAEPASLHTKYQIRLGWGEIELAVTGSDREQVVSGETFAADVDQVIGCADLEALTAAKNGWSADAEHDRGSGGAGAVSDQATSSRRGLRWPRRGKPLRKPVVKA